MRWTPPKVKGSVIPERRHGHSITAISGGGDTFLVFGGIGDGGKFFNDVYLLTADVSRRREHSELSSLSFSMQVVKDSEQSLCLQVGILVNDLSPFLFFAAYLPLCPPIQRSPSFSLSHVFLSSLTIPPPSLSLFLSLVSVFIYIFPSLSSIPFPSQWHTVTYDKISCPPPSPRGCHSATAVDKTIVMYGGVGEKGYCSDVFVLEVRDIAVAEAELSLFSGDPSSCFQLSPSILTSFCVCLWVFSLPTMFSGFCLYLHTIFCEWIYCFLILTLTHTTKKAVELVQWGLGEYTAVVRWSQPKVSFF